MTAHRPSPTKDVPHISRAEREPPVGYDSWVWLALAVIAAAVTVALAYGLTYVPSVGTFYHFAPVFSLTGGIAITILCLILAQKKDRWVASFQDSNDRKYSDYLLQLAEISVFLANQDPSKIDAYEAGILGEMFTEGSLISQRAQNLMPQQSLRVKKL